MRKPMASLLSSLFLVATPALAGDPLVIRNVNLVPMDREEIREDRRILIEDGRISEISSEGRYRTPREAEIIDGQGRYLMPGMVEMHAHIPPEHPGEEELDAMLFLFLANGVTHTRGMLGAEWHLELREELARGERLGPGLTTSGPSLNGGSVDSPEQGAAMVRDQAGAGFDFLKIHPGLTREEFDAIAEAADEAGIEFAGHVPVDVGLERALEAGYASIDHLDAYPPAMADPDKLDQYAGGFFDYRLGPHVEEERITAVAERTAEAGVWNVPTETLMHNVLLADPDTARQDRPELQYMPEETVAGWLDRVREMQNDEDYDRATAEAYIQARKDLLAALRDAGAGLLFGSDAPQILNVPGFSIHQEMAVMEAAGLSPYEILVSATRAPAEFFGEADAWGTIAEDRRADLVLLEGNPLEDLDHLREPAGVIRDGHWLGRDVIDERLQEIAGERSQ